MQELESTNTPNQGIRILRPSFSNPAGRPRESFRISDLLRDAIANGKGEVLTQELLRLAVAAKRESVRLQAIQEIADRTEGRCIQAIQVQQVVNPDSARTLAELAARIMPHLAVSERPLIDTGETGDNLLVESTTYSGDGERVIDTLANDPATANPSPALPSPCMASPAVGLAAIESEKVPGTDGRLGLEHSPTPCKGRAELPSQTQIDFSSGT